MHEGALDLVAGFDASGDASSAKSRELVLHLLAHTPAPFSRLQFAPGHITCTGLVLHPEGGAFLLIHHQRLDRWLLPGGHVEPEDVELWHAARREVEEETTVRVATLGAAPLVGIDVHGIPPHQGKAEPFNLHHDLIFAFRATSSRVEPTKEVRSALWHEDKDAARSPLHLPESIRLASLLARHMLRFPS